MIVDEGGINMVDDWDENQNSTVNPDPTTGVSQFTYPPVADPDCDGVGMTDRGEVHLNHGSDTISPGRYEEITVNPAASLTMEPGLYCITDGDFDISGDLTAIAVHIYMGPASGEFNTNAGATITLVAAREEPTWTCDDPAPATPDICDQAGLLLHVDELNTNTIHINGGADTTFIGTFLAPSARIVINGGSETTGEFSSQIIGDTVEIEGNADVNIVYDPDLNYTPPIPPQVWLAE